MKDAKIIALVGPTASGKTSLAIQLAKKHDGEVISIDSRQVYRTLDIGTEKVTEKKMDGVPHHLIDIVEPEQILSVQEFQAYARDAIEDILARGKIPILAGGSGQYMDAVLYETSFPQVSPNTMLRRELEKESNETLFKLVREKDKDRATTIDPNNKQRLIRALEIIEELGSVPPRKQGTLLYNTLYVGITVERDILKERITSRLQETLEKGLVEEVKRVRHRVGDERIDSLGLEYRIVRDVLDAKIPETLLEKTLTQELMGYAKRQMTWFKKNPDIKWGTKDIIAQYVRDYLG